VIAGGDDVEMIEELDVALPYLSEQIKKVGELADKLNGLSK